MYYRMTRSSKEQNSFNNTKNDYYAEKCHLNFNNQEIKCIVTKNKPYKPNQITKIEQID